MQSLLGCLFILIFGFLFFLFAVFRSTISLLFGARQAARGFQSQSSARADEQRAQTVSGNAHHEHARQNSRQRRSGKIFEQNEGEYVDFEEV